MAFTWASTMNAAFVMTDNPLRAAIERAAEETFPPMGDYIGTTFEKGQATRRKHLAERISRHVLPVVEERERGLVAASKRFLECQRGSDTQSPYVRIDDETPSPWDRFKRAVSAYEEPSE